MYSEERVLRLDRTEKYIRFRLIFHLHLLFNLGEINFDRDFLSFSNSFFLSFFGIKK